ncbi:hypothetical protein KQX54_000046, partial [Cotesia glomerata]
TASKDAALLNLRLIRHGTAYIFQRQLRNDELDALDNFEKSNPLIKQILGIS